MEGSAGNGVTIGDEALNPAEAVHTTSLSLLLCGKIRTFTQGAHECAASDSQIFRLVNNLATSFPMIYIKNTKSASKRSTTIQE